MAQVTAFTAERMKEIEDTTVVGGLVDVNGNLLLSTREGALIDAGYVKGGKGDKGEDGVEGSAALPAGTISLWASDVAPANWLICDGSAVSRTDYPSLFEAIGIKYGAGDGVNTFNLPNLKGRTPVGKDSAQTEFDALAKIGGEKAHLLTAAESGLPAHNHDQDPHFHHVGASQAGNGTADVMLNQESSTPTYPGWSLALQAASAGLRRIVATTVTALNKQNAAANASQAHNILQPYTVVNFIIKVSNGDTPGDSQLTDRVSELEANFSSTPAGTMTLWPSDVAPSNWLICDGAAVTRTTYASLFAAIGVKYGAGNGTTTFNLPNLKGRVPVGRDSAQAEFDTLGEIGGAKTHTLTVAEMPSHVHNVQGSTNGYAGGIAGGLFFSSTPPTHPGYQNVIDAAGGGGAHNNLQPYQVVNYIIKFTNGDTKGDSQLTQRVSALEASVSPTGLALRDRMARVQNSLNGGGTRKVTSAGISWTKRFILIGHGWEDPALMGYWDIGMPPNGTVIPVYGHSSKSSVTVANGEIPMDDWYSLYYDVPLDKGAAADPSRFKLVTFFVKMAFTPPPTWVLVAQRTIDGERPAYIWGDGRQQDYWRNLTLFNGWVAYDSAHSTPQIKYLADGRLTLRGLMKSGTVGKFSAVLSYQTPDYPVIKIVKSLTASARVDINPSGDLLVIDYDTGGGNGYVSLDDIAWFPAGS